MVIEEFLDGEEASFISMVDGVTALPMATAQDHKRVGDGDTGPNTGGMGAYSPAPVVTPEVHARVMREVVEPTVRGMIADGVPFTGFLYAGLMIDTAGAPKVIEFNVRFGDPETQPVMLRLQSDLLDLVEAAIDERLHEVQAQWDPRPSLGVVMAAEGYPGTPRTGDVINSLGRARRRRHQGLPRRHRARRRARGHHRRPRAVRVRAGRHAWPMRSASAYAEVAGHFLAWRVPSPRHRLARDRARAMPELQSRPDGLLSIFREALSAQAGIDGAASHPGAPAKSLCRSGSSPHPPAAAYAREAGWNWNAATGAKGV